MFHLCFVLSCDACLVSAQLFPPFLFIDHPLHPLPAFLLLDANLV